MLTQPRAGTVCAATRRCARLVLLALLAAGCAPAPQRPPATEPARPPGTGTQRIPDGAQRFAIDPAQTVVTVIVRRAGPFARLGHDHVVTSADESGEAWLAATPAASGFVLRLPVERFEVDLPAARAAAGPEFATAVPDSARAGTRQNMLRAEVLDAAHQPVIEIRSLGADGPWPNPLVRIGIVVRGVESQVEAPVVVERTPGAFTARGTLQVRQTDLGMTPFAVAGGAVQVADALEIRFEIAAVARD